MTEEELERADDEELLVLLDAALLELELATAEELHGRGTSAPAERKEKGIATNLATDEEADEEAAP